MSTSQPRIVIRRKSSRHPATRHGGSWKIAYADFVTAMMAFFLVMWLLSLVPQQDLKAIAEYFRMPLMEAIAGRGPAEANEPHIIPGGQPSIIPNIFPTPSRNDMDGDRRDRRRLEDLKSQLDNLIRHDPILKEFRPQMLLDMTPDGLRVQIIDNQNRPMFATGSAQIQPYMRDIMRQLGPIFNELPNSISVSGHTDAIQYATGEREYSNWELSADRANAARKELVVGGMAEPKIKQILGLSSSVSLIKDNPIAAVNRRISIVVLNRQAERRIDEQNQATDVVGPTLEELTQQLPDAVTSDPVQVPDINIPAVQVTTPAALLAP
ncbi:MAG: flagellar motor protein MotB [Burkholderiaceae bacterium]|nr:flagellar motor protein MotB [Burkholderiaceae bacterium]